MTDRQDELKKVEQKVEATGQSHVNAISNLNAQNVYLANKSDRNIFLDDWNPPFEHMQGRKDAIAVLNIALADPKKVIACIVGFGGYGKSTLAAKLFAEWEGGRFWADLSQRSRDFREFATRAIAQLGQKSLEQVNNLPEAQLGYELAFILLIRFAQRGKWQIALCFCIGLFTFPLFLAYLVALLLWRLIK